MHRARCGITCPPERERKSARLIWARYAPAAARVVQPCMSVLQPKGTRIGVAMALHGAVSAVAVARWRERCESKGRVRCK
jgi:hypothetical protein